MEMIAKCLGRLRPFIIAAGLSSLALAAPATHAALGINKTFNPINVSAGQSSTLTVILINNNDTAATGVAFADNLPGSVVVATPANVTTTCGGVVTATPGAASFSLAGGSVLPVVGGVAGQCTVTVDVQSPTAGVFINNIPAGAVSSSQGTNPQNANATLTVAALRPVSGVKAFAPGNLHGGGTASQVTLTLTNPNGVALTGAALTDTLPAGLAVASPPNTSTTCGAGVVSTGANSASLSGGTIPANGTCTIRFDVVASNPNAVVDGNVTNSIPANALTTTEGVTNTVFSATVRLQTGARVEKSFSPSPITTGGTSTMTVTIRNFNATPLTGIAFTDLLPGTMLIASPVVTATTCTGLTFTPVPLAGDAFFTVSGGSLPGAPAGVANSSCTVTVNVTATNAGVNPTTLTNTIPAGSFGEVAFSTQGGNLVVNAPTSVTGSKSFSPGTILQGGISTLTITLNNSAAVPANIIAFTDALTTLGANPQFTVAAAPPATTTCGGVLNAAPGANTITLGAGNAIPATGSCTIIVPVQASAVAATGTRTNTITQGALNTDQGRTQTAISGNLVVNPVLSVAKAFAPTTVQAGTDTRATITLTRAAGAVALTGLAFTDTLPAGHLVSATPALVNNCGGVVTATSGTNIVSLAGGSLAGGALASTCTILVNITTPAGAGSGTNTIAAGGVTSTEGFINPTAGSAAVTRVVTNVTLNKSFSPATVLVGGVSQLTINILNTNANAIALTNATLTDMFPLGMNVATIPGATNTCGGVFTPVAGATSVSLTGGALSANATCRLQVNVVANAAGNLINPLAVGAFTSAQGVTNPSAASATLAATGVADLRISKTDGVVSVVPGTSTTYTIIASNFGPDAVAGANVVDTPPAGLTFTSWTCVASAGSLCGNLSGSGPINELVSLLNGGTATYTVVAAIAPGATGSIANTATIIQPPTVVDPIPANNTATDTNILTPLSTLTVSKTGPASVNAGGAVSYTVVVTNTGPSAANGSVVQDPAVANFTATGVACVAGGGAVCPGAPTVAQLQSPGLTIPTFPLNGTITLTLTGTAGASGSIVNSATATPPAGTPGTGTATTTIVAIATLGKSILPATITAGGTATLTLSLGNPNATPLTLTAAFTDSMPAGVTTTSPNTGTCAGVLVTPTLITLPSGASIPPGGCSIIVSITSGTPGAVTNTTSTLTTGPGVTPPASAPLTVTAVLPTLAKSIAPATIVSGGTSTLTLTLGNANAVAQALTAAFSDAMPAGVTTTSPNTGTCAGVLVTPTLITMPSGAAIPAGGCTIIVTVTSATPGTVTNTTSALTTAAGSAPPASAPLTVTATTSALVKTILPSTITAGGTSTLTLSLANANATPLTLTVPFTDPMPAGVTTTSANTGTCAGVTVAAALITLPAGATISPGGCTIIVTITSATPGTVTNTTSALTTAAGSAPPATAPLTVTATTSALVKTILPATITAGGTSTLTLSLSNANAVPLTLTLPFTDPMPAGVTTTSANAGTCVGVTVTPTLITLPSGASIPPGGCTIIVTITSSTPGTATNVTSALTTSIGVTPAASAPLTVLAAGSLLTKTITPGTITPGTSTTLTITLGNPNATAVTLTAPFTDAMPAGVTINGLNSGTCSGVTVTPSLITKMAGSTIPAGGCTIVVSLTSLSPGTVTNTTSALSTSGGTTPPASATLTVLALGPPAEIPTNTPLGLAMLLLALLGMGGWHLRPRGTSRLRRPW